MSLVKVVKLSFFILLCSPTFLNSLPIDSDEGSVEHRRSYLDQEDTLDYPNEMNQENAGPSSYQGDSPPAWLINNDNNGTLYVPPPWVASYQRVYPPIYGNDQQDEKLPWYIPHPDHIPLGG